MLQAAPPDTRPFYPLYQYAKVTPMWMHILTGYLIISIAIMEMAMGDKIGSQDNRIKRVSFYISGLIIGPFAALYGVCLGIKSTWDSGGK